MKKAISLFSGAGGDSLGLVQAGYDVVAFSENNATAIETHRAQFPESQLLAHQSITDIKKIPDEVFLQYRDQVDLLFAGFPCFVRDTLVLTDSGYKKIQEVNLRDRLLTHTGQFRSIANLQRKTFDGTIHSIEVACRPKAITCTEEHPFYVREKKSLYNSLSGQHETRFGDPEWKRASKLTIDDYLGMVINSKEDLPTHILLHQPDQWFLMGELLKNRVSDSIWLPILEQFDQNDSETSIPEWVQDAPKRQIQEFVKGYGGPLSQIETPSLKLAYGFQRLFLKLGQIASVKTVDHGTYRVDTGPEGHCFIEDGYCWYQPVEITSQRVQKETVYNFEVEEDNSYTVCNMIAHNCQGFSHAGKKKADDPRNELVHEFVRAAKLIRPKWIMGENVKGLLSRKGFDSQKRKKPVIAIIQDLFEGIGYRLTWQVHDATDYGVPQLRKRLIIIGHRGDQYPHYPPSSAIKNQNPTVRSLLETTLEGAVEFPAENIPHNLDSRFWIQTNGTQPTGKAHPNLLRLVKGIRNKSSKELASSEDSTEKIVIVPEGLISFGKRASPYHGEIVDPDAPSKTVICNYSACPRLFVGLKNGPKHFIRTLTNRELGMIQGFPPTYPFKGREKPVITQIGNAVPPPMVQAIAENLSQVTLESSPQVFENSVSDGESESG
jgi:DNA (cytosine-5)-methyltransferase 1